MHTFRQLVPQNFYNLTIISFALQLVWENAHAPLYTSYVSFGQHFPISLVATYGDVLATLVLALSIGMYKHNLNWFAKWHGLDGILLSGLGFILAATFEIVALTTHLWAYTPAMPHLPYLHVGLSPVLQFMLLIPLSFYLTSKTDIIRTANFKV